MVSAATVIMSEDTDAVTAPKVIYTEDDIAGTLVIEVDDTSNAPYRVALRGDGLQNKYYYTSVDTIASTLTVSNLSLPSGIVNYGVYSYANGTTLVYEGTLTVGAVSFDPNGGSGNMSNIVAGGMYTLPDCDFTAPEGKTFKGWSTTADGEVITADEIEISGNMTLYAQWADSGVEPEYVTVKIGYNEPWGTLSEDTFKVEIGTSVTVSGATVTIENFGSVTATPKEADAQYEYSFVEWQVNGERYNGGIVERDMDIVAIFDRTPVEPTPTPEPVTGVEIEDIDSIRYGQTVELDYTVTPTGAPVSDVQWTSSNQEAITVDEGKITAVGTGSATITVTVTGAEGGSATDSVTISVDAEVTDVWFLDGSTRYDDSVIMEPGETLVLDVTGDAPIASVVIGEAGELITADITGTKLSITAGETLGGTSVTITVTDTEGNEVPVTLNVTVTTVYTISVEMDGSGSVAFGRSELSDNGYFRVNAETDAVLSFDPALGYALGEVVLDGNVVELVDGKLTISDVSDHHSVKVTFTYVGIPDDDDEYVPPVITVIPGDDDDDTTIYIVAVAAGVVVAILAALILMQTRKS